MLTYAPLLFLGDYLPAGLQKFGWFEQNHDQIYDWSSVPLDAEPKLRQIYLANCFRLGDSVFRAPKSLVLGISEVVALKGYGGAYEF
jgi:hypothetical protein